MPKYLIHIGPHKTGTTYLQLRFRAAREALRERGVVVPANWGASRWNPSHVKLVTGLRDSQVSELIEERDEIEHLGAQTVLISAEDLSHLGEAEIALLGRIVAGRPVSIIFYCRRWSELLPSLWQERVKHGHIETLADFVSGSANDPYQSTAMNFALVVDNYARAFGRTNIKIVSYSDLNDMGQDLAEHFFEVFLPLHRVALDGLPPSGSPRPNQSLRLADSEIIRSLNARHVASGRPLSAIPREWFLREGKKFDLAPLYSAIQLNLEALSFSDDAAALRRLHAELFAAYGDLMVQPRGARFFAPRNTEISVVHQRYSSDRAGITALDALYAGFLASLRTSSEMPATG